MGPVHETKVSLSFFGDDLDPAEVTALLGGQPSFAAAKGEKWITAGGNERIAKKGSWQLRTPPSAPGDIPGQVARIFAGLTDDLTIWQQLTQRFQARLFCGLFMEETNEGLGLAPAQLHAIGQRGLFLDFDIYGPTIEPSVDEA